MIHDAFFVRLNDVRNTFEENVDRVIQRIPHSIGVNPGFLGSKTISKGNRCHAAAICRMGLG